MRIRFTAILILVLIIFSLYSQENGKVIILHTNDMHSKIDNLGKIAYLLDSLKRLNPYVYLVSSGDNFTGNPVVDLISNTGYPMIDLMNRCGFAVSAIGNHEFDMGQPLLNKRIADAKFPFISCNINSRDAELLQPQPFIIIEAGTLAKIAFLSAIQLNKDGFPDTHPSNVKGITFKNGIEESRKYGFLKERYGILICLTHLGIKDDIKLAEQMPQLDIIMGGHSHTLIDTILVVNGVRITQAGANMNYIGKTTLEIVDGKVINATDEIIPVKSLNRYDTAIQQLIEQYNDVEDFKKVTGFASKPVTGFDELGSLMTDALNHFMKTDFAFQNKGGIRISSLDSGNITLRDIYRLDPFGNQAVVFKMNLNEIKSLIRYGFELESVPDLQVSGMKYVIHTDDSGRCKQIDIEPDQANPDPEKYYLVSMNGYIAATYKFDHRDAIKTSKKTTAEILIRFLDSKKTINYSGVKRVDLLKDR